MTSPKPEQFAEFYKAATLAIAERELAERRTREPGDEPEKEPAPKEPFPWQKRLAARVCDPGRGWPRAIALPTAAGKTGCIDVAVFALACRLSRQPRRIFFVVDRRVVVDQAWMHATKLAEALDRAEEGVLRVAADALRDMAEPGWLELLPDDRLRILHKRWAIKYETDDAKRQKALRGLESDEREWYEVSPLDVYALRGGMYRESAWARSPLQPTVIASTVDQVGSRLLFRGYGVSDSMKPVHAGLVGNDALILLDEAHCAKPFDQTAQGVTNYRKWCDEAEPNPAPFHFVSLTATPTEDVLKEEEERQEKQPDNPKLIERDEEDDRTHAVLGPRISASKPAKLVVADKAKGKEWGKWGPPLVEELAKQARGLMGADLGKDKHDRPHTVRAVGVIVNRVATARRLAEVLRNPPGKKGPKAEGEPAKVILLTGRMRPLDRDRVLRDLEPLFSGKGGDVPPVYVVATQCLEVGADLDFHALVTECASLDALRQRFGRLNRVAARPGAKAAVVIRADQTEPAEKEENADPVYGNALANTWKWLEANAKDGVFDFGVSAVRDLTEGADLSALNAPSPDAPVLFPAHLDCWVQSNPVPTPEPEVSLFLHGSKEARQPDVQVVFRADLGAETSRWAEVVSLCPPSSSEAVPVPIGVFKKWLADELEADDTADVEGDASDEPEESDEDGREQAPRHALRWRGPEEGDEKTKVVSASKDVTPLGTYVVPCDAPGAQALGDFPEGTISDDSAEAFQRSRDRAILPLPAVAIPEDTDSQQESELLGGALNELRESLGADSPPWLRRALAHFAEARNLARSDLDRHPVGGVVLTGRDRLHQFDPMHLDDTEPGESFRGRRRGGRAVSLKEHSRGVADFAERFAAGCGLDAGLYEQAGLWHDLGKLDPRFQAMLKQSSPRTALFVGEPLAKSGSSPGTPAQRERARAVHRYPNKARHELLSAALVAEKTRTEAGAEADDLLLHLIATHHGSARPFADAVEENDAAATPFEPPALFNNQFRLSTCAQQVREWNAELPERFWRVVRKYGWWGAAYREAVFRLADHAQSAAEQEGKARHGCEVPGTWAPLAGKVARRELHALPLPGLDGSNPLGFLAALGVFVVCDRLARAKEAPEWLRDSVALAWGADSPSTPVLHLSAPPPRAEEFVDFLASRLARALADHPCEWVVQVLEDERYPEDLPATIRRRCAARLPGDRPQLDWVTALVCESVPTAASQLQTVRRDYLLGNLRSIMARADAASLCRCLLRPWDYADALDNQSLHWEPSEDRRHAYQWHQPNGDPTRKRRGGMLGANRLALEAWPLFPSFPDPRDQSRIGTRGFRGNRASDTFWVWPLWSSPLTPDSVASILALGALESEPTAVRACGVTAVYRSQRILVGKTPNFTPADALL